MDQENTQQGAADRLVLHYGGRQKAADALGVTGETIRLWRRDGIPVASALDVEQKSGGIVRAEEILAEARARAEVLEARH